MFNPFAKKRPPMNVVQITLAPIPVIQINHRGPYVELSAEFVRLWDWIQRNRIPAKRSIGIYWDNPDYTAAAQLRSSACAEVAASIPLPDLDGLPIERGEIAGGSYATTQFVGPYEELTPVWSTFTNYIEKEMRLRIVDDKPAFEIYLNDPSDTAPENLITELYMPVH